MVNNLDFSTLFRRFVSPVIPDLERLDPAFSVSLRLRVSEVFAFQRLPFCVIFDTRNRSSVASEFFGTSSAASL